MVAHGDLLPDPGRSIDKLRRSRFLSALRAASKLQADGRFAEPNHTPLFAALALFEAIDPELVVLELFELLQIRRAVAHLVETASVAQNKALHVCGWERVRACDVCV